MGPIGVALPGSSAHTPKLRKGMLATESGHSVAAMVPFLRVLLAHESEPGTNSHSQVGGVGSRTTRMGRETQKKRSHAISRRRCFNLENHAVGR